MPQVNPMTLRRRLPGDAPAADTVEAAAPDTTAGILDDVSDAQSLPELFQALSDLLLDIATWTAMGSIVVRVFIIVVFTTLLIKLIDKVSDRMTSSVAELPTNHPRRQRALTISNLISSTARYILWPVALIMVMSVFAIDVAALIATAGIAGLAIGFGAQTLVKDVISGIFLLVDDTIHVGDFIKIGEEAGTVEYIGVRLIRVRKFDGEMLMIPAGELRIFGNRSIGYARLIVNIRLSYHQDIDTILPVMERVANEWAKEKQDIVREEQALVQAITDFTDSSVNARIVMMVAPGEQFGAEREIRLRLKREFDRLGIEIPYPHRTVHVRKQPGAPQTAGENTGAEDPDDESYATD